MDQQGVTVWFTGLSGAGKSTLADAVEKKLKALNLKIERLDGDIVRQSLTKDLGFSKEDRDKNIERVTFVAKLLTRHGVMSLVSFISPYRSMRDYARKEVGSFVEVYVKCPLDVCAGRDVKGLYAKAQKGEIPNFTGVSDPYEEPLNPEITVETHTQPLEVCVDQIITRLRELGYVPA